MKHAAAAMFKIARGLGHKTSGKQRLKYRLDVFVEKLDNLPKPLKKCRVVWSRGPKVQMTDIKDVTNSEQQDRSLAGKLAVARRRTLTHLARVHAGAVVFKQKLSQIATMYKDPKEGFEPKASSSGQRCTHKDAQPTALNSKHAHASA